MSIPSITTERLLLRAFEERDLDAYAAWSADPEVMRYLAPEGRPMSREEAWRSMATVLGHWTLRGYGMWALEERATGEVVGRAGPWWPEGRPGLEVGWTLARAHWGRGFAVEAGRAGLDYAFDVIGADHVISLIDPRNARSIHVAERLGERHEGEHAVQGAPVRVYGIARGARPR